MHPCIARLSSPNSCILGNSVFTVRAVSTCPNKVADEMTICASCKMIPFDVPISKRLIHGKLCDEIPGDSRIYGSRWYWRAITQHGETTDTKWITFAKKAQKEAEDLCGKLAYKVQRPAECRQIDMAGKKAVASASSASAPATPAIPTTALPKISIPIKPPAGVKKARAKKSTKTPDKVESTPEKVLTYLTPKVLIYKESIEPIEQLETDSYTIQKRELNGQTVWITENSMVFSSNPDGSINDFIGYFKNDTIVLNAY